MKISKIIIAILLFNFYGCATAQIDQKGINAKENRTTDVIVNGLENKTIEFTANTMYPLGRPSKNLVGSDYSITFSSEKIVSFLPYYGVSHRLHRRGRDKGMRFEGKPLEYAVVNTTDGYKITAVVKTKDDTFSLLLDVGKSGYATLNIDSSSRESISYQGEIGIVE